MAKDKCDLSNEELTTMCRQWVSKLCETGGKAWTLEIPVNYNKDPDLLICELIDRFKKNQSIISPSRGFTVEEMRDAYISGCNAGLQFDGKTLIQNANEYIASLPLQSKVEGERWILPSVDEAGAAAVLISEKVNSKLTAQEQALFIAGFQECIKWIPQPLHQ